jgi:hypothetical protein
MPTTGAVLHTGSPCTLSLFLKFFRASVGILTYLTIGRGELLSRNFQFIDHSVPNIRFYISYAVKIGVAKYPKKQQAHDVSIYMRVKF